MTRVAVLQSNYIPWKGYFDIIHDVDVFVFYDDVQYTKNDWRNRNLVKTVKGTEWLSIPVGSREDRLICDVEIHDTHWPNKHWRTICQCYGKTPHFARYEGALKEVYLGRSWQSLSALNQHLIGLIARQFLGIETALSDSREFHACGAKLDRLLDLLSKVGATSYVSGPAARDYIDAGRFQAAGIELHWKDYRGYPEYPQRFPPFTHQVTILDLLFNTGPDAPHFIWGWRSEQHPSDLAVETDPGAGGGGN